jgi:hypothetical protein
VGRRGLQLVQARQEQRGVSGGVVQEECFKVLLWSFEESLIERGRGAKEHEAGRDRGGVGYECFPTTAWVFFTLFFFFFFFIGQNLF